MRECGHALCSLSLPRHLLYDAQAARITRYLRLRLWSKQIFVYGLMNAS